MSAAGTDPTRAVLRVVRGEPTAEDLAVVAAVMSAAAASASSAADRASTAGEQGQRGRWNDPAWGHRRPVRAGPGAWHSSLRA